MLISLPKAVTSVGTYMVIPVLFVTHGQCDARRCRRNVLHTGMGSRQFCRGRGRGKAAMFLTEARQGRGRELEAEARQTKLEARPRRGRAKSMLFVSF